MAVERALPTNEALQNPSADSMKDFLISTFSDTPKEGAISTTDLKNELTSYLSEPLRILSDPKSIARKMIPVYSPFAHAFISLVEDSVNGVSGCERVASSVAIWFIDKCVFESKKKSGNKVKTHPAGFLEGLSGYVQDTDTRAHLEGLHQSIFYGMQTLDALRGVRQDAANSYSMRHGKSHTAGKKALFTVFPQGYDRSRVSTTLGAQIGYIQGERMLFAIPDGLPTLYYIPETASNPDENLAVRATMLHTVAQMRKDIPNGSFAMHAWPGNRTLLAGYRDTSAKGQLQTVTRTQLMQALEVQPPDTALSSAELSTCFRFLFDEGDAIAMKAKIGNLTDSFLLSTQRIYSGGYHIDLTRIHNPYLKSIGMTSLTFHPEEGNTEADVQFRGQNLRITIDREGHCAFPQGFSDPEAQTNLELIIKAHLVEAMHEDSKTGQPIITSPKSKPNATTTNTQDELKPTREVAYLKGLPYGDKSKQILDEAVNTEVSTWTGVPFATLNDVFRSIQLLNGFDPLNPASYSAFPGYSALTLKAQKLIDAVFGRFPQKISAPIVQGTLKTPKGWSPGLRPSATVERRLLCELAYVKEVKKYLPSEEPIVVDTSSALKHYREILPPTPIAPVAGTVYSAPNSS